MSTVQTLYTDLAYYIGEDNAVLNLFNIAVRMIAKRLYWHESDLITGIFSVPIYASVTLTASDIAFVDSDPDTITGVAAAFVTTGFDTDMPITTDDSDNPGPFHVETVVAGTLTLHADDSLTAVGAGASVTITSDDAYGFLPSDFWGLVGLPYLDGQNRSGELTQAPRNIELNYSSAGYPRYFRIRKNKLYVIPETSSDYTVKADYFQRPTAFTELTDTLPFDELFDDIIGELVVRLFKAGSAIRPEVEEFCRIHVDSIAQRREKKAPRRIRQGINYDNYL